MRPGIIQLIGLPGVGKTAVGTAVAQKLGIDFIDFADLIVSSARSIGIELTNHDDIMMMPVDRLKEAVDLARRWLLQNCGDRTILLETHVAPFVQGVGYRFTPPDVLRERNTLGVVLLVDRPEGLSGKRKQRKAARDSFRSSGFEAELDQQVNLISAVTCCSILGVPLLVLWNQPDELYSSIDSLTNYIIKLDRMR